MYKNKFAPIVEFIKDDEIVSKDMPEIINAIFLRTRLDSKLRKLSLEAKEILKTKKIKKSIKFGKLFKLFDELEKIDIEGDKWTKIIGFAAGLGGLSFMIGLISLFISFNFSILIDNNFSILIDNLGINPIKTTVFGALIGLFFIIKMKIYQSIDVANDFRKSIIPAIRLCKNQLILDSDRDVYINFDFSNIEADENFIKILKDSSDAENEICVFRNKGVKLILPFKDKGDITIKVQKEISKTYTNEKTYRNNQTSQDKRLLFQSGIIKITVSNSEKKIREIIKFNKTKIFNCSKFYANPETIIEMIEEL